MYTDTFPIHLPTQTVSAQDCPLFHRLISAFFRLTDVPMLLNTSLNRNAQVYLSLYLPFPPQPDM